MMMDFIQRIQIVSWIVYRFIWIAIEVVKYNGYKMYSAGESPINSSNPRVAVPRSIMAGIVDPVWLVPGASADESSCLLKVVMNQRILNFINMFLERRARLLGIMMLGLNKATLGIASAYFVRSVPACWWVKILDAV